MKFLIFFIFLSFFFQSQSQKFDKKELISIVKNQRKLNFLLSKDTNFIINNLRLKKTSKKFKTESIILYSYKNFVFSKIEIARSLINEGKFNESIDLCNSLLQNNPSDPYFDDLNGFLYNCLSINYAFIKDTLNCFKFSVLYSKLKDAELDLLFQPVIYNLIGKEKIEYLAEIQDSVFIKYNHTKLRSLESMILLRFLIKEDQYLRIDKRVNFERIEEFNIYFEKIFQIITEKELNFNDLFIDNNHVLYYTILFSHTSKDFQIKYFRKIVKYLEMTGRFDSAKLIIDKVLINLDREQLYGTQFYSKDNKCLIYPITKKTEVEVRNELGL
jgi:hypothetical protein